MLRTAKWSLRNSLTPLLDCQHKIQRLERLLLYLQASGGHSTLRQQLKNSADGRSLLRNGRLLTKNRSCRYHKLGGRQCLWNLRVQQLKKGRKHLKTHLHP